MATHVFGTPKKQKTKEHSHIRIQKSYEFRWAEKILTEPIQRWNCPLLKYEPKSHVMPRISKPRFEQFAWPRQLNKPHENYHAYLLLNDVGCCRGGPTQTFITTAQGGRSARMFHLEYVNLLVAHFLSSQSITHRACWDFRTEQGQSFRRKGSRISDISVRVGVRVGDDCACSIQTFTRKKTCEPVAQHVCLMALSSFCNIAQASQSC